MKTQPQGTLSAILTPLGEGGIGVVQIAGPQALAIAERIFRPTKPRNLRRAGEGRLCHGFVFDEGGPVDEVIVRVCPQAMLVEINCHGGIAAVKRIHGLSLKAGAAPGAPEDLQQATIGRDLDHVQREAFLLLARAPTKLAVRMLLAQYNGALSARLSAIEHAPAADAARDSLEALLRTAPFGMGLCVPRKIVVVGKPNVGKSTLVNALLREDRVIVHHLPGTTCDAIGETAELQGIPFELVDTAGIRQATDDIETIGVAESRKQIGTADIILLVLDLSSPIEQEDEELLTITSGANVIPVANKADRSPAWDARELPGQGAFPVSALTGSGLRALEAEIVARCSGATYPPEQAVVFTERQRALLASSRAAFGGADMAQGRELIRTCLRIP